MAAQLRLISGPGGAPKRPSSVEYRAKMFYTAYPRHVGWGAVVKAYPVAERNALAMLRAQDNRDATVEDAHRVIMEGLERAVFKSPAYTPHPTTWLNRQQWLDEPEPTATAPAAQPIADGRSARLTAWLASWRRKEAAGWCEHSGREVHCQCANRREREVALLMKFCPEAAEIVDREQGKI